MIDHFPFVLGRNSGFYECLDSPYISRRHCSFSVRDGQIWLQDLGSRAGTFVNGERLETPCVVRDGDVVIFEYIPFRLAIIGENEQGR